MKIADETDRDAELSRPTAALVDMLRRLPGDIIILGIAGKMGITLGRMAARASREAGLSRRIIGVSRFSDPSARQAVMDAGIEAIACDLLDPVAVEQLPPAAHVLYMVGRKFGTAGSEPLTWAVNTLVPHAVARRYASSRIVVFSTGCVYPLVDVRGTGCRETDQPAPIGEYGQASLGRERVFEYLCETQSTPILLYRLNYAIDLRYGVLHDIARWIWNGEPVPLNVPVFNCIWQQEANERALLCLEHCSAPADILNVTGASVLSVRDVAVRLGEHLGKPVTFTGCEGDVAYLADASESVRRFGAPKVSVNCMIEATAAWLRRGGVSLDKPTHFETSNGTY